MIYLRYDPKKPGDRNRVLWGVILHFFLLCLSIAIIIYFVYSLVKLFNGEFSENTIISFGLLTIMAVIVFYFVNSKTDKTHKKEVAKKYFLLFFCGSIVLAAIIGIIVSVNLLCHKGIGAALLVGSIITVLVTPVITLVVFRKISGYERYELFSIPRFSLEQVTRASCYIALFVFLVFNIKMALMYGWKQVICYIVAAGVAIGLNVLFNKRILPSNSKKLLWVFFVLSTVVIVSSISLRIVYEAKVDNEKKQIPLSGSILVSLSEETEYYNLKGTGYIGNPSTNVKIGDNSYDDGDIIPVKLNNAYSMRVSSGGSGSNGLSSNGYTNDVLRITQSSFSNGEYVIIKNINFFSGPANTAKVTLTFTRYCTFWEVVFS